jgi:hypothetical protein
MKIKPFIYIILLSIIGGALGCKKDNYEAPESMFTGKVVYEGQAIGVRTNEVQLELWQHGYSLFTKIPVFVAPDGTFSARLFDGDYKLTMLLGSGPWLNRTDSIDVKVQGNTIVDFPVTPYSFVRSATYQRNGSTITATANVQTVSQANALESVNFYVFSTALVDNVNKTTEVIVPAASIANLSAATTNITIPAALSDLDAVYVRVGVKTAGIAALAFSPAERIALK